MACVSSSEVMIGTECEIFSASKKRWYSGTIRMKKTNARTRTNRKVKAEFSFRKGCAEALHSSGLRLGIDVMRDANCNCANVAL